MLKTINNGKQPTKGSKYSAGIDLYANEDVVIGAGETEMVGLGVKIDNDFLKKMFIYDDEALEIAQKFYPKDFKRWFKNLKIGKRDKFEFELYNSNIMPEKAENYDPALCEYYTVSFNGYTYKKFLEEHYFELHPRSSLRAKGLIAGVGIIDMDYKDEIKIIIHKPLTMFEVVNDVYDEDFTIKKGDKIAQILLKEHKGYLFGIESDEDRKGGFGSTDKENSDG